MKMPHPLFAQLIPAYDQLHFALLRAQTFDPDHYGFPELYYQIMESDQQRVDAFRRAFEIADVQGKVVCEAGVGRLAISQLYLPKVRKAYLIETNPQLFPLIEEIVEERGWGPKVELIFADARQVQLPEGVDFVIGEMMSIFCANEFQVAVFQHLRQFLRPGGQLIPGKIINLAQLAHVDFAQDINHYPINFTRHWPELLSSQVIVNTIELSSAVQQEVHFTVVVTALLSGVVNALLLRSFIELVPEVNFTGSDSLMPPTVLRLLKPVCVVAGTSYQLRGQFTYGTSLDEAVIQLEGASS